MARKVLEKEIMVHVGVVTALTHSIVSRLERERLKLQLLRHYSHVIVNHGKPFISAEQCQLFPSTFYFPSVFGCLILMARHFFALVGLNANDHKLGKPRGKLFCRGKSRRVETTDGERVARLGDGSRVYNEFRPDSKM